MLTSTMGTHSRGSREMVPPGVNITEPKNEAEVSGEITIKGHAWDSDGKVISVQLIINSTYYNATDDSGNNTWYQWSLLFNTTILKNGEWRVAALAKDNDSKLGDNGSWIIVNNSVEEEKENHWPYVNITQPANEATVSGNITIKGHAWDIDGNITLVQVKIGDVWYNATDTSGNGSWYTWSLKYDTTILEDGEHRIVALSKDDGGKLGDFGRWIIVKNDKEEEENHHPYVKITHPSNEAKVSGIINIKGRAWDEDGDVTSVRLRIADVYYNAKDISGNGTWYYWSLSFNTTKLKDGEYKVVALAKDDGGKLEDTGIWIIIKNTPEPKENHWPYVNITQPKNEAKVSGNITIKGYAWDIDGNVTSVRVRIADVWYNASDTSGNGTWYTWSLVFDTTKLEDDEYRVVALSKDDGGKLGDFGRWIIVKNTPEPKENKAPFIVITSPSHEAKVKGVIKIKGKAWDIDGKVTKVKIKIKEVCYEAKDESKNGSWYFWSVEFNTSKLENGEYRVTGAAYDGKVWEDTHIVIIINNTVIKKIPSIQILTPKMEDTVSGNVNITGKAWGPMAIQYVQVRIGDKKFNATDTSGNNTWYTWKYVWNTTGYENDGYNIGVIVYDGKYFEDTHVEVKLNNIAEESDREEESSDPEKEKGKKRIPGFELPLALIAGIVVVVAFFRRGDIKRRTQ